MKINNVDIDIDEAIKLADVDKIVLKRRKNNILLSDYQMMILLFVLIKSHLIYKC